MPPVVDVSTTAPFGTPPAVMPAASTSKLPTLANENPCPAPVMPAETLFTVLALTSDDVFAASTRRESALSFASPTVATAPADAARLMVPLASASRSLATVRSPARTAADRVCVADVVVRPLRSTAAISIAVSPGTRAVTAPRDRLPIIWATYSEFCAYPASVLTPVISIRLVLLPMAPPESRSTLPVVAISSVAPFAVLVLMSPLAMTCTVPLPAPAAPDLSVAPLIAMALLMPPVRRSIVPLPLVTMSLSTVRLPFETFSAMAASPAVVTSPSLLAAVLSSELSTGVIAATLPTARSPTR